MAEKLDPLDVAGLERSLNDSATRVSTIWVSYVIFALYLVIATGTATHRQLFLEEPFKLPVLTIDLPLYWFFVLAPFLFVIFHLYVLLQVLLLGRTAAAYNSALDLAVRAPPKNASMRQRLANTLFAQIFAGSPREREGWLGFVLKAMAWITLALMPIYVVLSFQLVFLPYHSGPATWSHRVLVLVELAAAFVLWPLVLDAKKDFKRRSFCSAKDFNRRRFWRRTKLSWAIAVRSIKRWRRQARYRRMLQAAAYAASAVLFSVSWLFLSFPGEPLINLLTAHPLSSVECDRWIPHNFDRLNLPYIDVVDGEKLAKIEDATAKKDQRPWQGERTRSFRFRDLACGNFNSANLRRVDFAYARLQGANLGDAELQDALFLQAYLQGADLNGAQLQGASLAYAKLQAADLSYAQLQGAYLAHAHLQNTDLIAAQLQGASLAYAELEAADLSYAQLQGAVLFRADLQGADLFQANLQGASLAFAQLQGADFSGSALRLASFQSANLWHVRSAECSDADVLSPKFEFPFTSETIQSFIESIVIEIPPTVNIKERKRKFTPMGGGGPADPYPQAAARKKLSTSLLENNALANEKDWVACADHARNVLRTEYYRRHAAFLRDLVCNAGVNRKEVAAGIVDNWIFRDAKDQDDLLKLWNADIDFTRPRILSRSFLGLDDEACPATKDLSDGFKRGLSELAARPRPPER